MDDEVLTPPEVAKLLRVGRTAVYRAVQRREIPHRRLGKKILFSRTAVLAWLEGQGGGLRTATTTGT